MRYEIIPHDKNVFYSISLVSHMAGHTNVRRPPIETIFLYGAPRFSTISMERLPTDFSFSESFGGFRLKSETLSGQIYEFSKKIFSRVHSFDRLSVQ